MRKITYKVNGYETASYKKARELQPTGKLETNLNTIECAVEVDPKTLAKRQAYFAKKRAEASNVTFPYKIKKVLDK